MDNWVKTHRVSGEIFLATGASLTGDLHLQPVSRFRNGGETPLELLNREDRFFSVLLPDGEVRLVAKDQTVAVVVGAGAPDAGHSAIPVSQQVVLEVLMADGRSYKGEVIEYLPPNYSRAMDLLNMQDRFFALDANGSTHYLNRSHVLHVRPFD
jgi:hypothetical protein